MSACGQGFQYRNEMPMFEAMFRSVLVTSLKYVFSVAAKYCHHQKRPFITEDDIYMSFLYHMINPKGIGKLIQDAMQQIIALESGLISQFQDNPILIESAETLQASLAENQNQAGDTMQQSAKKSAKWVVDQLFDETFDLDAEAEECDPELCTCEFCQDVETVWQNHNDWEPQEQWQEDFYRVVLLFDAKREDSD